MNKFKDKTLLITGGTGSFGHALLERVLSEDFGEIRIFSRDELKQEHMRVRLKHPKVKFLIGDVRDRQSVEEAMTGADYVFHAAALKQVPSCEFFPMQAVMTNVTGGHNVLEAAVAKGVSKVVCLSTDKAVYPINVMGMTKALMEKLAQAAARANKNGPTTISCVRYGNVMCSRGSVIPLFVKQIREKRPISITRPEMTRFLLPLRDAIELVLFAFNHAEQGDILIKKSSASTIVDLANALKNLAGSNVPIKSIGIRHGEKIHETLATHQELRRSEDMGDYVRVRMDDRNLNYDNYFTQGESEPPQEDYTSENTRRFSIEEVEALLQSLPEVSAVLAGEVLHA